MRRALILFVGILAVSVPAHPDQPPPQLDRPASFGGTIKLPRRERDEFTVVAVRRVGGRYHEVLGEGVFGPGQFRLDFPGPDGGIDVAVLSPGHVPVIRGHTGRHHWERKRIRPEPWTIREVPVRQNWWKPIAGAKVTYLSARPYLASCLPATLLSHETRTGPEGNASVRLTEGISVMLRVETDSIRTPYSPLSPLQLKGTLPVYLFQTGRPLRVTTWRDGGEGKPTEMFGDGLTVKALSGGEWRPVNGVSKGVGWEGRLPAGTTAVRVEAEGLKPWTRVGLDGRDTADLELFAVLRAGADRKDSRLTVRTETPERIELPPLRHFGCGGCVAVPLRRYGPGFRAEIRRPGAETFAAMVPESAEVPSSATREPGKAEPDVPPCGFQAVLDRPGECEVRVRAMLGAPRTHRIDVPADSDVEVAVDVSNQGGIRIVKALSRERAAAKVSFRLETADGAPVPAEYGGGMFNTPPLFSFEGPVYTDVPNKGILRVDPGVYRIVFTEDGEDGARYTVRVRPDSVRRLDTRFAKPDEASPKRVRIR